MNALTLTQTTDQTMETKWQAIEESQKAQVPSRAGDRYLSSVQIRGQQIEFYICRSEVLMSEVGKLRYEIYVEEMKRNQKWADHDRKTIREPMDAQSFVIGAFTTDGKIVGTGRLTFAKDCELPGASLYDYSHFSSKIGNDYVLTTKLMIRPEYRRTFLCKEICSAMFQITLEEGALANFIDSNEHLIPLYSKFGFQAYKGKLEHEDYGLITPMVLFSHDVEHFTEIKSPLLPLLKNHIQQQQAAMPPEISL